MGGGFYGCCLALYLTVDLGPGAAGGGGRQASRSRLAGEPSTDAYWLSLSPLGADGGEVDAAAPPLHGGFPRGGDERIPDALRHRAAALEGVVKAIFPHVPRHRRTPIRPALPGQVAMFNPDYS